MGYAKIPVSCYFFFAAEGQRIQFRAGGFHPEADPGPCQRFRRRISSPPDAVAYRVAGNRQAVFQLESRKRLGIDVGNFHPEFAVTIYICIYKKLRILRVDRSCQQLALCVGGAQRDKAVRLKRSESDTCAIIRAVPLVIAVSGPTARVIESDLVF